MVHTSAFHPYTRPTVEIPATGDGYLDESLRLIFSAEALLALAHLQDPATNKIIEIPKQVSPIPSSTAPILSPTVPDQQLQSPTVNNIPNEKSRRKRTTFSPEQATRLESEYLSDSYMAREKRLVLAQSLSLSENQVKTWFQNRRAKDKRDRKIDNLSNTTHSRKSSPSRKSSSDSSPTPLQFPIQTATSPTTVESLLMSPSSPPAARTIQKVENPFSMIPNLDALNNYLLANQMSSPPLFNPSLIASFQNPLQSAIL